MHITTENIEEWCFRYLEKDLSNDEIIFFEKELSFNPDLSLELNKWKKTFLTNEGIASDTKTIQHSLYRFKHQVALLLAESVIVIGLCAGLFVYANKETTLPVIDTPSKIIESAKPQYKIPNNERKGSFIINKPIRQTKLENTPSVADTSNIEPSIPAAKSSDSITHSQTSITPTTLEDISGLKPIKDSSQFVKKPKATTKKGNIKRNYPNGSRVIPLNNDL